MRTVIKIQALIAIILLGVSGYLFISETLFLDKCTIEKAKITEIKIIQPVSDDNQDAHFLMLQLVSNGKTIDWVNYDSIFGDLDYKEGQVIEIYYDKSAPENSEVKNFSAQWSVAILFLIIFVFETISMFVVYAVMSKRTRINPAANSGYTVH